MNNVLYTGSEIILKSLELKKVKYVFGYPGGSVLPLYDALYSNKKIKHILTRHEQAAGHAADGYYRSTGKIGVVFATSGPGATNLVTSIANAQMDSIPMIIITGQVLTNYLGKQSFQEAPITKIVKSITKYTKIIYKTKNIFKEIEKAFIIANEDRKGPVLLDIPKDVLYNKSKFCFLKSKKPQHRIKFLFKNKKKYLKIANIFKKSKKPLILLGGGAIEASLEIKKLLKKIKFPVTYSLMGKGIVDDNNPLNIGMIGMHGTATANYAVQNCDVLFALGVRFDDRQIGLQNEFAKNAKIIHVNIDKKEFNKNIKSDIFLNENSVKVVYELNKIIKNYKNYINIEWMNQIKKWKNKYKLIFDKSNNYIKPQEVLNVINKITNGKAMMVTEVGQHQMWAAQYYKIKKANNFITSGGLGTMGFGLPASIGVQLGNPKALVVLISGDGSIQMNSQELMTISENNLPIKILIINNKSLGMVRQWQKFFYKKRYSETIFSNKNQPDFKMLANSYKIDAIKIKKHSELFTKLEIILKNKKPYLIEIEVDPEFDVYPMVPSGKSNDKMIFNTNKI